MAEFARTAILSHSSDESVPAAESSDSKEVEFQEDESKYYEILETDQPIRTWNSRKVALHG